MSFAIGFFAGFVAAGCLVFFRGMPQRMYSRAYVKSAVGAALWIQKQLDRPVTKEDP